ncbi:uncharacterized membrane protein (UPF0127 family) [Plasticicumulans acidivorans]|uniref:Uncharacterized membrane protein (UPF0127 family) n=2 Tax=Plasticicumulans acidivorans TaxID=886464 RepID=A0A317N0D0_9GAMM|nr:uncharacterized membrane protein (UPF0127 family) [Plasticicumulans acidivorans]
MYRLMLPRDQGMLFVLPRPQVATFWMKNTYLPLDILYFDANRRLRTIHRNVPPCRRRPCPTYASTGPVLYVLEINAGEAARHAIQPEQPLHIDGGVGITD